MSHGCSGIRSTRASAAACSARALIAIDHDAIDYRALVEAARLVIDTRNACARAGVTSEKLVRA